MKLKVQIDEDKIERPTQEVIFVKTFRRAIL